MTSKSYIVLGEAPESDTEENIEASPKLKDSSGQSTGKVIGGEAPESDEESNVDTGSIESVESALSASSLRSLTGDKKPVTKKNSSLLVKKLRERNTSLYKNVREFVGNTVSAASNDLNATNQQLLKCQVQLQEAADILKTLKTNLSALDVSLQSVLPSPFVPEIVVNEKIVQDASSSS